MLTSRPQYRCLHEHFGSHVSAFLVTAYNPAALYRVVSGYEMMYRWHTVGLTNMYLAAIHVDPITCLTGSHKKPLHAAGTGTGVPNYT